MKVVVIGAGGIGSLFGGRLAAAGHDVWLVHRRREIVDALRQDGLLLESAGGSERITVYAATSTEALGTADLVLVATKATDTRAAAEAALPVVTDSTVVVTVQNGLGNLEILSEVLGRERVLVGMTYVGAALLGPGVARHTAVGNTFVGEPGGDVSARATELAAVLTRAGLPTEATDQLWSMVWGKLVINAALNATAALLGAAGADVLRSKAASEMVSCVARETAAVAGALGVQLPYADPAERVLRHCRDVGPSKPSMLQDVEQRRPTEIDAINGAIVREGARLGIPTPYNHALLLLVRGNEELYSRP